MADDLKSRYSIFVPSPKARINLGKPDLDAPFGYTGLSLQSDVHFLVDVNKVSMFQSGGTSCWQVGAKWLQWSNGPMHMSSTAVASFTASNKITIAAGAGQGQITALDHGLGHVTPRPVEYNNLDLHYTVEEVHNSVKALFYGAANWKSAQKDSQATQVSAYTAAAAPDYSGSGFLGEMAQFLKDHGYDSSRVKPLLQPLEWEGDHVNLRQRKTSDYNSIKAFDPYAPSSYGTWWLSKTFARFAQVVVFLQRTVDLLKKVGPLITDNMVGARVQTLITAWGDSQNALNNALNVADIARFDRGNGSWAKEGGAWNSTSGESANILARTPQHAPASDVSATAAEIQSAECPHVLEGVTDTVIHVRSAPGGTPVTIDFADLLTLPPARIFIEMKPRTCKLSVSGTPSADDNVEGIILNGDMVLYNREVGAWRPLPAGIEYHNGAFVAAVPFEYAKIASWVTLTPDPLFNDTNTLLLTIDGEPISVPLTSVIGADAKAWATTLASAISVKKSGAAVAQDEYVIISSTQKGPNGSVIGASTSMDLLGSWVGASSAVGGGYEGTITAAQLLSKLSGIPSTSTSVSDETVSLTHDNTGKTNSYLEVRGPLAAIFFGSDPAVSRGTDAVTDNKFFRGLSDMRSVQYEMAKWPEDIRNQTRPLYEAVGDVAAVVSNIQSVMTGLSSLVLSGAEAPKSIGLIAGGGITLGAKKALFQTGKSVTIIATQEEIGPDKDKFVPGAEYLVYKAWEAQDNAQKWIDSKVTPKPKDPVASKDTLSGFRVVSGGDVKILAKSNAHLAAIRSVDIDSTQVKVTAKNDMSISALSGDVTLYGANAFIGRTTSLVNSKQVATETVYLRATNRVTAVTDKAKIWMDKGTIQIGKREPKKHSIDKVAAFLQIDTDKGELMAGVGAGADFAGLAVPKDGKTSLTAKDELSMGVGAGAGIKLSKTEVSLATASFKVGTAFLVKSNGKFSAAPYAFVEVEDTKVASLTVEYNRIKAEGNALQTALKIEFLALATLTLTRSNSTLPTTILRGSALSKAIRAQQKEINDVMEKIDILKGQYATLVALANGCEKEVGICPDDAKLFAY